MVDGSDEQVVGLMIVAVHLPRGARIDSAELVFEVDDTDKNPAALTVEIRAERSAAPAFFSTTPFDVSTRQTTSASATWEVPNSPAVGERVNSSDVSAVVQEVVDLSGWDYSHAIVFILRHVSGSGIREYKSNGTLAGGQGVPALRVSWRDPALCALPPLPPSIPHPPGLPPSPPAPPDTPLALASPCLPPIDAYSLSMNSPPATLTANNLGGHGPGITASDPPWIQFDNIGTHTVLGVSTPFHLRIENTSAYVRNGRSGSNGRSGFFGNIAIGWGRSVDLRFSFFDGAGSPVTLADSFYLDVYDIDGGTDLREEVSTCDASEQYLANDTNLVSTPGAGTCVTVRTTLDDNSQPYPFHPTVGVPPIQLRHSVTFRFDNRSAVDLTYTADYGSNAPWDGSDARSFYFAFGASVASTTNCYLLASPPPPPPPTCLAEVVAGDEDVMYVAEEKLSDGTIDLISSDIERETSAIRTRTTAAVRT